MAYIEKKAQHSHDICSKDWSYKHYIKASWFEINVYDIRYRFKQACKLYHNPIQPYNLTVLDIGCGDGYLLSKIEARGKLGIDLSLQMIERAKSLYPDITFKNHDIRAFKTDSRFDVIFCLGVAQYNENLYMFMDSIISFLNHKGTLIISFPNDKSIFRNLSNRLFCKNQSQFSHSFEEFIVICKSFGLEVIDMKAHTFSFFSLPKFLWPLNMLINLMLEKILFGKIIRGYLGLSYICKFEKNN